MASGLEAAHARGLVHRDVKPANVLIENQRHAYLTDFGLTKRATAGSALTRTGLIVGTTDYLAPEQIQGDKLDARGDVYALGCVLYEALTGFVPYPRDTGAATMWAHMSEPPPSVLERAPDVPVEYDVVVSRAMAKDPNQRFTSAEALGRALQAAAADGGSRGGVLIPETSESPAPAAGADTRPAAGQSTQGQQDLGSTRLRRAAPSDTMATPEADATSEAPRAGSTTTRATQQRSPRVLFAAGVVALVLVAAAAAVLLSGGGDDADQPSSAGSTPAVAATTLPEDLEWQPIRDAPFRRQYAAATAVGGRIWVLGGVGVKASSTTTKVYDPATDRWTTGPGLPLPLHHFMAVTYEGEVVVIGGFVPGDELTSEVSDRVFVLRDGTSWEELPSLNHPRAAAAAAVVGDKIVVVGGQADGKLVPETEVFDGQGWKDVAEMPTPREHLGAASDGRFVYAVGGRELSADKNVGALERYDPASDSWTELEPMPTATGSVGAGYAGGRVVAVGGESSTSASDVVQGYDIQKRKWSELPNLPEPRHGVAVTALKDSLYAIGGATTAGHIGSTQEASVLDLSGRAGATPTTADLEWHAISDTPTPQQYAAATELGGRIWLFGGIGKDETASRRNGDLRPGDQHLEGNPSCRGPLHHFMAVTYEGEVVVMGGFVPGDEQTPEVSGRVFVLRRQVLGGVASLNHPRGAAAAAVVGDKIVVVGGQADGKLVPQTEVFDGHGLEGRG